jgi:hypothetical protein
LSDRAGVVLSRVLRVMRPLARLLVRTGVSYPVFAQALKRVFLEAAQDELAARGSKHTDSALTLLSGVHRRDVRELLRTDPAERPPRRAPKSLAAEVVARWLGEKAYLDRGGAPRKLPRQGGARSFDALVEGLSRDVRPRAVLEELKHLGAVREDDDGIALVAEGYAPREGFEPMADLFADNLADHAAAAALNLVGERNALEQAVFVDEITEASVAHLQQVAVQVWRQSMRQVLAAAQSRHAHDARHAEPAARNRRARFGVYFHHEAEDAAR